MILERLPNLLDQLYAVTDELEEMTGRPFPLDGHLVGSIGESVAAYIYGLELTPPSTKGHDALWNGKQVEIKATFKDRGVAIRHEPEHLLALRLYRDGTHEEIYNGPGEIVWAEFSDKKLPSNGQYVIGLGKLRELAAGVPDDQKIPAVP